MPFFITVLQISAAMTQALVYSQSLFCNQIIAFEELAHVWDTWIQGSPISAPLF